MEKEINVLKEHIDKIIRNELAPLDFCEWYENWYNDVDVTQVKKEWHEVLDDLFNDIGYFEPNSELRSDHNSYFGEEELLKKVRNLQDKLVL